VARLAEARRVLGAVLVRRLVRVRHHRGRLGEAELPEVVSPRARVAVEEEELIAARQTPDDEPEDAGYYYFFVDCFVVTKGPRSS
jgi:hypothetical protein